MNSLLKAILMTILLASCSSSPLLSERSLRKLDYVSRDQFLYQVRLRVFKDQIVLAKDNKSFCSATFPEGTNFKRPVTKAEFVDCLSTYLKFESMNLVYKEYYDLKKNDALFKKAQNFLELKLIEVNDLSYMGLNEPLKGEELAKALKQLEELKNK